MPSPETIFFALTGGILPALLWLWFWLHEDRLHPEPRGMLIKTFFAGMLAVPLVLPLEQKIQTVFAAAPTIMFLLWAAAEELFKWLAARFAALRTKDYDEPIDAVVYLLTAALGFSALENTLFLAASASKLNFLSVVVTGNLRFIGATLLHVLSSGVLGLLIGMSFWKSPSAKRRYLLVGFSIAVLLHTAFNLYIMGSKGSGVLIAFLFVWLAIFTLIVGFGKIKRIKKIRNERSK